MKLEDQVVSLELAKKLKELGVKQESVFMWSYYPHVDKYDLEFHPGEQGSINVAAYTVAELGEKLSQGRHCFLPSWNSNFDGGWYYKFFDGPTVHEDTLANCMAKMLIYLIENNLITL